MLEQTLLNIHPIDPHWIDLARKRKLELTKPPGSLGRLEDIANHRIVIRNCDSYERLTPGRYIRVAVRTTSDSHWLTQALARELNA